MLFCHQNPEFWLNDGLPSPSLSAPNGLEGHSTDTTLSHVTCASVFSNASNQKLAVIEVVAEADLTPEQTEFAAFWTHEYFGHVSACQNRDQANVHWRMFVRDNGELVSHLSLTELAVQLDDSILNVGSIGSVFTVKNRLGEGFANLLMDYAEDFLLLQSQFSMAILFCLPELVPFYQQRDWHRATVPVTLEQTSGEVLTWSEECMILDRRVEQNAFNRIHIPIKTDL